VSRVGVAAFDFDGTLLPRDSFLPFLVRVKGYRSFGWAAVRSAPTVVGSLAAAADRDAVDRDAIKEALVSRTLGGYPAARLGKLGDAYGAELAARLSPSMTKRIDWHRRRAHRLVLVSASLDVYLAPLGRLIGFDAVLATRLEVGEDGLLTGRLEGLNCRGQEKELRLRSWLAATLGDAAIELWAYGDSAGDRELLAMADHPTRVGRRQRSRT
jgi:phosphatidylglycerophosphatase C